MKTVTKTVFDPSTGNAYEIKLPAPEEVKTAILELEFPPEGMTVGEAAVTLADTFQLSETQQNAKNRSGYKTFRYDVVMPIFKKLSAEGTLEQPRGPYTPYIRAEIEPFSPNPDPQVSVSIEEIYQRLSKELSADLIQIIRDCLAPYEKRFDKVDAEFNKVDARFDKTDESIKDVEGQVDARFDKTDENIKDVEVRMNERFDKLHEEILKLALTIERLSTEVEWMKRIVLGIGGAILLYIIKTIFFG